MQTLNMEPTLKLNTRFDRPKNIVIVGAGGTGGYFIRDLSRQVALQNQLRSVSGLAPHIVTVIEQDDVELKNLTRQNFIQKDVGLNKGEVVAQRYGAAFGLSINYVPEYVTGVDQLENIVIQSMRSGDNGASYVNMLVDCVDNNKTRVIMKDTAVRLAENGHPTFLLSSGNEEWTGQAVCSYLPPYPSDNSYKVARIRKDGVPREFRTPLLTEMFPEVLEAQDKLPTELSCAERAVSAPQNILTNMNAAQCLLTFAYTILTAKTEENEGLTHFAVMYDAQTSMSRTIFNKQSEIEKYYN